jgi:hypothetical protein
MTTRKKPENISLAYENGNLRLDGYPDGARVIALTSREARQLEHYAAHQMDLEFAKNCLDRIVNQADIGTQEALWRSAIIFYHKCFTGGSARSTMLKERKVYKGNDLALQAFAYFRDLRNKHLIHDENSFSMVSVGAIVNSGNKPYKVEKIVTNAGYMVTLQEANFGNLNLLVDGAINWVNAAYLEICEQISRDLEQEEIADLLRRPELQVKVPTHAEIGKRRPD